MARNVKIIKNEFEPETPEVLASSLIKIAEAFEALNKEGGITLDGIVALLSSMSGMSQVKKNEILLVLENLTKLKSYYVRKAVK